MLSELIQNEETGNHIIAFEIFKFNPIKKYLIQLLAQCLQC